MTVSITKPTVGTTSGWGTTLNTALDAIVTELNAQSGTFVALAGAARSILGWFVPTDPTYGAKFDGTTDDRAAVQACVDAAVAQITATGKGATVLLPPGVCYFGSGATIASTSTDISFSNQGVLLPVNLVATLRIVGSGRGVTTIKLSSACRTAFSINKTADYQTFQKVETSDFDIDNNSVVGRCHVLLGNIPAGVKRQYRLSFADLRHERHRIYNVPVEYAVPTTTTQKFGVGYIGQHVNAQQDGSSGTALSMEATQTSSKRIYCADIRVEGAANALAVCSWLNTSSYQGTGPTNHYYDRIVFERCQHIISTLGTARYDHTSFFICGSGIGEYGAIIDCYSENVSDDAIEVGGLQHFVVDRFTAKDPYQVGILIRQSQPARDVRSQKYVIRDMNVRVSSALSGASDANSAPVLSFIDNSVGIGTIETHRFLYETTGQVFSAMNALHVRNHLFCEMNTNVLRWVHVSPRIVVNSFTFDATTGTTADMAFFYVSPPAAGSSVTIRDADVRVAGWTQTSTGGLQLHLVMVEGTGPKVLVENFDSDLSGVTFGTASGATSLLTAGKNGSTTNLRVTARNLRPSASANVGSSGASKWGVRPYGNGLEQVSIESSELGTIYGLSGDIDWSSASTQRNRVMTSNNVSQASASGIIQASANYTMNAMDSVVLATGGASGITVTLPTPRVQRVTITKVDSGAGAVSVAVGGSTINGNSANYSLASQYSSVTLENNGTFWFVVASK